MQELDNLRLVAEVNNNFDRICDLEAKWGNILRDDVDKWQQKAKEFWFKHRDQNSRYFHAQTS